MTTQDTTLGVDIRMVLNVDQLLAGQRAADAALERTERSVRDFTVSVSRAGNEATEAGGDMARAAGDIARVGREADQAADDVRQLDGRLAGLASGLGALAGGFAIGGIFGGVAGELERIRQAQFDAPTTSSEDVQRIVGASARTGIDEGRVLDVLTETQRRIQESITGASNVIREDLAAAGVDVDRFISDFDGATDAASKLRVLVEAVRSSATPLAVAEALGGDAANAVLLMANNAAFATQFFDGMNDAVTRTPEELARLTDANAALRGLTEQVSLLAGSFASALTPAINGVTAVLGPFLGFVGTLFERVPGLAIAIGGALTIAVAASAAGFVAQGIASLGAAFGIGAVGTAATAATPSLLGMAAAAWAAVAPLLPFIAIGALVVGAVAAIAIGVNALANAVGGFGNLWSTVWDYAQVVVLGAVRAMLIPLDLLIAQINAVTSLISLIPGIDIPTIQSPGAAIDDRISNRLQRANENLSDRRAEVAIGRRREEFAERQREIRETNVNVGSIDASNNGDPEMVQDAVFRAISAAVEGAQ